MSRDYRNLEPLVIGRENLRAALVKLLLVGKNYSDEELAKANEFASKQIQKLINDE